MQKYRLKLDKKPNQLKAYLNDLFKILKFFKFHIIVVRKKKKIFFHTLHNNKNTYAIAQEIIRQTIYDLIS